MTLFGQPLLDYIGSNLGVQYEVTDNTDLVCESQIMFRNDGDQTISRDNWSIYMYHLRHIGSDSDEIDVEHIVGGLFKLSPTPKFADLKPGGVLEVALSADQATVSRYSLFPNWYVAQPELEPRLLMSTEGESLSYVKPFIHPKQWKRALSDKYNPYTPSQRFKRFDIPETGKPFKPVLPTMLESHLDSSKCVKISNAWVVFNDCDDFFNEAQILAEYLNINMLNSKEIKPGNNLISFQRGDVQNVYMSDEAYMIKIDDAKSSIDITAPSSDGAFYAIQTIISLLETPDAEMSLPTGSIKDAPRFPYRGLHLDVSRNFASVEEVMKIIRVISMYKMNRLHFHLTDDEGWRLEINDIPELTEVGSKRDHNLSLKGLAVEPTLGSGPHSTLPGSGFYTADDYKRILQEAKKHHVEVIPEIDMPGHSYAAMVAMSARYEKYKALGDLDAAVEYLLVEEEDESSYESDQKYTANTMNPCVDGTKKFVEKIISTLKELHEPIQPLRVFHVGGDEVPSEAWDKSPKCQRFYESNGGKNKLTTDECGSDDGDDCNGGFMVSAIQRYFIDCVQDVCTKHDLHLAVWNDGIHDPNDKQVEGKPKMVHAWRLSQHNDRHNPYTLANSGFDVVISSATHTYLDHPYEPDPEENGLHWCVRTLDVKTMFEMKPFDMYSCQQKNVAFDHENLKSRSSIIGIQAQIWRELMRTDEMLEYMLFPRILAIAERAWHEASWETDKGTRGMKSNDWASFTKAVGCKELARLDKCGITYRIPPPGIHVQGDKVLINALYPGIKCQFRMKGDKDWQQNPSSSKSAYKRGGTYEFSAISADGTRHSRPVELTIT